MNKRICIIGAGVAGLATAKVLAAEGHAITVFDRVSTLGGVWSPDRRYPGVKLQTTQRGYSYSDFPMPTDYPEFPSGEQVFGYLCSYARAFGIDRLIRCRCEVREVVPRPDGARGWCVVVRDLATAQDSASDYDLVIVCNGVFSEPAIPNFPGVAEFEANGGVICHSSRLRDTSLLKDRDVVIIGFGKSALDIAEVCLPIARSTAIVGRRIPWKVPHRISRANIHRFILSRFTEIWFPHPEMGLGRRILHTALFPVVDAFFWLAEFVIGRKLGMNTPALRPDAPLRSAGPCITLALDNLKAIREGAIALHRSSVARFTADGIELQNAKKIRAQVAVLATGYRRQFDFLRETERATLHDASGAILLYRGLINPDIPDMAFNGYNGVGVCQLAAEAGAAWLARWMEGSLVLPDRAQMLHVIREEIEVRRRLLSASFEGGIYVTPFTFGYFDQVLRDLGLPPADQHRRLFKWLFTPIQPSDYRDLVARSRRLCAQPTDVR